MPQDKLPIPQFAAKIKAKYPQYKGIDDTVLVQKILAKYPEYNEQVDMTVMVKKKEPSSVGAAASTSALAGGGQVGSSKPQSEKEKVIEYLKVTKPQVSVTTPSAKEAESVTSIIKAKGVKQPITQVKFKKDESPFDQTKEEAFASASDKLNEVMYGDGDGWLDPIKANITKAQNAPNSKEAMANIGANNLVEMSLAPSGYYADKVLKNSIWSQASGDNLTANMLRQKADDYQKRTAAFQGIQKSESDTGSGNANKEFYNYVYGQQIDNAAIKSYAEKNPNFKEQLIASGIELDDPYLADRIGSAKAGQIISESIFDPEVIEYAKNEAPWLLPALKSKASTLITDYKDFGVNLVANKVSRAIQESGYNNIDPIFNFANDNIKEFARSTAKLELTPEEYAVYEKNILGNEEKYLDTPSFFEGFASAGKSMLSGAKSTLTTPFKSIPETIREGWEKEATNVSADPKGLMKVIRDSGHAVGIVSSLAAIGNVLGGGGTGFYSTKVVPALSGAIPFMGDFVEEGTMKYPNNPVKAWTSALFNTAMYSALSYKIFPVKDVQNAFKNIKPEVAEIVENLASGRITREVARQQMSTVAKKGFDLLTGSVAKSAKISAELTGITALNSMLDKVMGMSGDTFEKYHPEGEEADAFTSLFLSNLVVGGIAKFGEMKRGNRIVEQSLYAAASNPKRFQDIIDKMEVKDPTINKQEMLDNLTYLTQVKDGLDKTGVDPKNQARYLFEAMKEKVQADAIKSTPDANITRMGESKINESRKIKDRILEGEDVVGEEQAEVEKESGKGKLTAEQILDKAVNDGEIKGIYADMVKAGQGDLVLKDIAQQAQNLGADGEPLNDGNEAVSKKSMISQFGKEVVDAAIERYKYTNGESEQISQPIELDPTLPEGYELPGQPKTEAGSVVVGGELTDEARIERRKKNENIRNAPGSTYWSDVSLKNSKIGDEIHYDEYKDGKFIKHKTKVKDIVDGEVIFENGQSQKDVSSYMNITAEDAWFAKNKEQFIKEQPKEEIGSVGVGGDKSKMNQSEFAQWIQDNKDYLHSIERESTSLAGEKITVKPFENQYYDLLTVRPEHREQFIKNKGVLSEVDFNEAKEYYKTLQKEEDKYSNSDSNPDWLQFNFGNTTNTEADGNRRKGYITISENSIDNFKGNISNLIAELNKALEGNYNGSFKIAQKLGTLKNQFDNLVIHGANAQEVQKALDIINKTLLENGVDNKISQIGIDGKNKKGNKTSHTRLLEEKIQNNELVKEVEQSLKEQPKADIDAKKEAIETEKQQAITEATKPVVDLELLGDEQQTIDLITEKASGDKDGGKAKIRQHERIRARLQALKDLIDCV